MGPSDARRYQAPLQMLGHLLGQYWFLLVLWHPLCWLPLWGLPNMFGEWATRNLYDLSNFLVEDRHCCSWQRFFTQFNYLFTSVLTTEKRLKVADLRTHNIQLHIMSNHMQMSTHTPKDTLFKKKSWKLNCIPIHSKQENSSKWNLKYF